MAFLKKKIFILNNSYVSGLLTEKTSTCDVLLKNGELFSGLPITETTLFFSFLFFVTLQLFCPPLASAV